MFRKLLLVLSIVVVLCAFCVGIFFALQNGQEVAVDFYFDTLSMPMYIWFFLLILIGVLVGFAACFGILMRALHLQRALRRTQRMMSSLQG